jgi:Xaa-Pro aminopeptidase
MKHRIVTALQRRDENGDIYDLTRVFMDEMIRHPFARDVAFDPGRATAPRVAVPHMLPSSE